MPLRRPHGESRGSPRPASRRVTSCIALISRRVVARLVSARACVSMAFSVLNLLLAADDRGVLLLVFSTAFRSRRHLARYSARRHIEVHHLVIGIREYNALVVVQAPCRPGRRRQRSFPGTIPVPCIVSVLITRKTVRILRSFASETGPSTHALRHCSTPSRRVGQVAGTAGRSRGTCRGRAG